MRVAIGAGILVAAVSTICVEPGVPGLSGAGGRDVPSEVSRTGGGAGQARATRDGATPSEPWKSQPVLDVSRSPQAKVHGVPVRAVRMRSGFWSERRRVNVEKSIPSLYELFEANGIIDNFRRLSGRKNVPRRGPLYTDSDVYKWMEAVAFALQSEDRPELRALFDRVADDVLAAQEPSGYLNTYYQDERRALRFTEMHRGHELYCLGHLLQAAIAYYRATGNRRLLDGAAKYADYVVANFGPDKKPALAGHPEIELALVELYRVTGQKKYLDFAGYILRGDGARLNLSPAQMVYAFSGRPFTGRTRLEGHAVRAMYACSGATDYFLETGDPTYWATLQTLWRDMVGRKMYITGGVGSRQGDEAFGEPYELPNQLAYTESCAAIGNFFWNWRLLAATGDARYTDLMERTLYNGVNSGMSLDGTLYCYRNPLALTGDPEDRIRNPWYTTTCCPPNLERVLASLPGYLYGTSPDGIWVHLYHSSELDWHLDDGTPVQLTQTTNYPWDGTVDITVNAPEAAEFTVHLRIPGWASLARVTVNGTPVMQLVRPGTYHAVKRLWKRGDRLRIAMPIAAQLMAANPRVADDIGKVAAQRGPLIYCLEGIDQPDAASLLDVTLAPPGLFDRGFTEELRKDLLGGVLVLHRAGRVASVPLSDEPLYRPAAEASLRVMREVVLTFIPYYAFANREPTPMVVWVPLGGGY